MGCFSFKSGKNRSKSQKPVAAPARTPPTSDSSGQKSKASSASTPSRSIQELSEERGAQRLRVFDLEELSSATNGFSRALKVGEGGFGSVYRAFFRSAGGGRVVLAVKRLNQRSLQGHKQWLAEVQFLGVLEHPNLVKLIGYCAVDSEASKQRLLVYEFMPNKTLDDHLFNRAHPPLSWRMRDFKASNVLLDADFKPKLSDFGLAREGPTEGKTHVSTASFRSIMDPRLGGRYPLAAAREVARLADRCLLKNPKERPAMRDVVEELERVLQMEPPPPPPAADKKGGDGRPPPSARR
ncbi:hypothetical protein EJB05_40971 [Eragrostis curvula]|uniref:Protein kinase domain-containing protein n=1 Tax=Eragrostis curvula TaxID=38414 RepID=A0A5J9T8N0_9POAL|nr:hypothetical protein EJB05_40971 [Eragrostis curvula]